MHTCTGSTVLQAKARAARRWRAYIGVVVGEEHCEQNVERERKAHEQREEQAEHSHQRLERLDEHHHVDAERVRPAVNVTSEQHSGLVHLRVFKGSTRSSLRYCTSRRAASG